MKCCERSRDREEEHAITGSLDLVDEDGKTVDTIGYKPDDVIVFQPGTCHGWRNDGAAAFDFLDVVQVARASPFLANAAPPLKPFQGFGLAKPRNSYLPHQGGDRA